MSGLVLKLQPGEQILVNGVVMQNGDRRAQLRIKTKDANILRLRDAMHPDEANTPVKRVYYAAQLVVAGEAAPDDVRAGLLKDIDVLLGIFRDEESTAFLKEAARQVDANQFYFAMRELKRVLPMEETLLSLSGAKTEGDNGQSEDRQSEDRQSEDRQSEDAQPEDTQPEDTPRQQAHAQR